MRNRSLPFVCLSLLLTVVSLPAGRANVIGYEVSPVFTEKGLCLHVQARFKGDADGTTVVSLPFSYGGANALYRCIRAVETEALLDTVRYAEDSSGLILHHAPGQLITLRYEVFQDIPGEQVSMRYGFRPLLQPGWFHILGSCLFLLPQDWRRYDITIDWVKFPSDWVLHNSFGSQKTHQEISAENNNWLESVFVGGDFRILQTRVGDQPVYLALRGNGWSFSDSSLLQMLKATVEIQRDFWQDRDIPYYTVTLLPLAPRPAMGGARNYAQYQYMGIGLTNSFAAFATPTPGLSLGDLCHLFHHELMHDWIGCKIRNGGPPDDMSLGWFSEGFTEYFAYKNMLAGGFITPEQYVERLNLDFIDPLYAQPMGQVSNKLVASGFFHCQDIAQLPYQRGCVFAFFLDNAIKQRSGGQADLHDFMLEMLDHYYEADRDLYSDFDFFLKNLSRYLGEDATPLYQRFINQGELIPLEAFNLPPYWKFIVDLDGLPILQLDQTVPGWREGMMR